MNSDADVAGTYGAPLPHLCMGLSRCFGTIAYFAVAIGLFKYLANRWGYSFELVGQAWEAGAKGKALVFVPGFVGLFGLALGQSIGASVRVTSDRASMRINVLWHLFANGQIGWITLSLTVMSLTLRDKTTGIAFMKQHGIQYGLSAASVAAIGCTLIAFVMWPFVLNPLRQRDERWRVGTMVGALLVGISMGITQSFMWGLSIPIGGAIGFLLAIFLIPASSSMWEKDQSRRFAPIGGRHNSVSAGLGSAAAPANTDSSQGGPANQAAYLTSPLRYSLDLRGKRVFDSAVALHRPFLRYSIYEDYSQSEVEQLRSAPELCGAEKQYKEAIDIEVANAGDITTWEQITYLSNAIRAQLWLALLYRQRLEFPKVAMHAQQALALIERLPEQVRSDGERLGMRSDAMFRLVEMDHFLGNGTPQELLRRYQDVLDIDHTVKGEEQAAEVRERIAHLQMTPLRKRHYA